MKRIIVSLIFIVFSGLMFAYDAFDLNFSCTQPTLNVLKVSYFDPAEPYSQPIFLCLTIKVPGDVGSTVSYDLDVEFFWNGGLLTGTTLTPVDGTTNKPGIYTVTNRDLITSTSNAFFEADGGFSFDDIIDSNPQFKDFVLETGKFPDGNYRIDVTLTPDNLQLYAAKSASVSFKVRGIQSVRIISPGVKAGATDIPIIFKPVLFNWNTAGFDNNFVIEIKEFDQSYELDPSTIEYNGRLVEQAEVSNRTIYNPDYSFQENKYYAWRAKVRFIGEETLNQNDHTQYISSNYHVFQYDSAPKVSVTNAFQEELLNSLMNLNIAEINALFEEGYFPKDGINLNGNTYYGKEAVDKLKELFMTYTIKVSVE